MEVFCDTFAFQFLALEDGNESFLLEDKVFIAEYQFMLDYFFLLKNNQYYHQDTKGKHDGSTDYNDFRSIH
jgi:hypothetical protein